MQDAEDNQGHLGFGGGWISPEEMKESESAQSRETP